MFGAPSRYAVRPGAGARYRDVDVAMRVEGATPHGLIAILFEELLKSIDTLSACERTGERARGAPAQSRALSVLHGLETSLDFERGGEIAQSLATIYREARRLLSNPPGMDRATALTQARNMLADIAGAWNTIG